MIDYQDEKTREALINSADSDDGKVLIQFFKDIYAKLDTNAIDSEKGRAEVEIEFHGKLKARELLSNFFNILGIKINE